MKQTIRIARKTLGPVAGIGLLQAIVALLAAFSSASPNQKDSLALWAFHSFALSATTATVLVLLPEPYEL